MTFRPTKWSHNLQITWRHQTIILDLLKQTSHRRSKIHLSWLQRETWTWWHLQSKDKRLKCQWWAEVEVSNQATSHPHKLRASSRNSKLLKISPSNWDKTKSIYSHHLRTNRIRDKPPKSKSRKCQAVVDSTSAVKRHSRIEKVSIWIYGRSRSKRRRRIRKERNRSGSRENGRSCKLKWITILMARKGLEQGRDSLLLPLRKSTKPKW